MEQIPRPLTGTPRRGRPRRPKRSGQRVRPKTLRKAHLDTPFSGLGRNPLAVIGIETLEKIVLIVQLCVRVCVAVCVAVCVCLCVACHVPSEVLQAAGRRGASACVPSLAASARRKLGVDVVMN